ncbi:acyl-homoserine-lactone synthase [Pragia fontium]|uniref:Acyl-homoserine-lactone synthase n=2 Tax=Pragia fontium TaxID=82985 RepID=A0AAJ5BH13_9GAMM|nr:acyl-homoserine-lactone synthase [Pragia fontium]AKJ42489.1 N-acylhomoserine lactone synthase [Pragia fontium]SFC75224.1 N-acyl-L-homoserine lactone synthetase [Pragia fontium DSM 5563 = ATCC 49100]SUB82802.1 Acyl-homoserine-lactone synthase [Pragia fontium]VEJ55700.1 Acyl-homoserine-lactone synthase [Pragia fontium]GKX62690.1 acyl-homoserine-lactone synthase [Pragia fontium]
MEFLSGSTNSLPGGLENELAAYRYKVFVEKLGWELDTPVGYERDQFDKPETIYVVARNSKKEIIGCSRLLPTSEPYLLSEIFPELLNGTPPPHSPFIWEISRFSAMDLKATSMEKQAGSSSSAIAVGLLRESINYIKQFNATTVITVSPLAVERLIKREGYKVHRGGAPMLVDGHPVIACVIDIT